MLLTQGFLLGGALKAKHERRTQCLGRAIVVLTTSVYPCLYVAAAAAIGFFFDQRHSVFTYADRLKSAKEHFQVQPLGCLCC